MRYRRFGRTELQVSAVSLGGAYWGGKEDPERAEENARADCAARSGFGLQLHRYSTTLRAERRAAGQSPVWGAPPLLLGDQGRV